MRDCMAGEGREATNAHWRGQHFCTQSEVAFQRNAPWLFSAADALDRSQTTPAVVESHRTEHRAKSWGHTEKRGKR